MTAFDRTSLDSLAQSQPAWRAGQMSDAFAAFQAQEVPTRSDEEWRYVELDFDLDQLEPATGAGAPIPPGPFTSAALDRAAGVVTIIDGRVVDIEVSVDGLSVDRSADVGAFEPAAAVDRDKFAAAHTAFASDGVRIATKPGALVEVPLVVDIQATQEGTMSFPHLEVALDANSEASLIVVYRSPDDLPAVVVPGVNLSAGDAARLRYLAVQGWGEATYGLTHQKVSLGRDATGRIGEVGLGGKVSRLDLVVDLVGSGGSVDIVGLYFGEGEQILDYRMVINHIGRNTSSDVYLKGAVEDHAQSVFTGLLRIEKGALRSSAFETNRNLVLSENAKAHSVPNLEILCDDVMCGHGSSVGPLEEEHLYYLQSRGIPRERAERMLIRGFFSEVIDRLPIDVVAEPVRQAVFRRFVEAQEGGRLA